LPHLPRPRGLPADAPLRTKRNAALSELSLRSADRWSPRPRLCSCRRSHSPRRASRKPTGAILNRPPRSPLLGSRTLKDCAGSRCRWTTRYLGVSNRRSRTSRGRTGAAVLSRAGMLIPRLPSESGRLDAVAFPPKAGERRLMNAAHHEASIPHTKVKGYNIIWFVYEGACRSREPIPRFPSTTRSVLSRVP
jgi:hypothetical protein